MRVTFLIMVLIGLMSTTVNDYSAKSVRLGKSLSADSPCHNFPPFPRCGIVSRPCHSFTAFISEASRPGERALSQNSVFLANRPWQVEVRARVCVKLASAMQPIKLFPGKWLGKGNHR